MQAISHRVMGKFLYGSICIHSLLQIQLNSGKDQASQPPCIHHTVFALFCEPCKECVSGSKHSFKTGKPDIFFEVHGWMQEYRVNYYGTHAPLVAWFAIRLKLVFGILFSWYKHQIDFIMAYPHLQAPIKMDSTWKYFKAYKPGMGIPRIMSLNFYTNLQAKPGQMGVEPLADIQTPWDWLYKFTYGLLCLLL